MSEWYPDDEQLLALTADAQTGVEFIETGKAPYYLEFRRMLDRLLRNLAPLGLRVYKTGPLAVRVKPGCCWLAGQVRSFPGSGQDLELPDDDTSLIYLAADCTVGTASESAGWPTQEHIRLARVSASSGSFDCDDLIDLRGGSLLSGLSSLRAEAEEISRALAGASADVTAAHLSELVGGGETALHSHAGGGAGGGDMFKYVYDADDDGKVDIALEAVTVQDMTATVAQINQALTGVSENVTAANLSALTGGGETELHCHAAGSGDMLKSVYDADADGVVDDAAAVGGVALAGLTQFKGVNPEGREDGWLFVWDFPGTPTIYLQAGGFEYSIVAEAVCSWDADALDGMHANEFAVASHEHTGINAGGASAVNCSSPDLVSIVGLVRVWSSEGGVGFSTSDVPVFHHGLPTTDPGQAGRLWCDPNADNVIKVSQGS